MKFHHIVFAPLTIAALLAMIGCKSASTEHKVVATGTRHSVPLYHDEDAYKSHQSQPDAANAATQTVDDQTPVIIVASDENGAEVRIIAGPLQGQSGFVPKKNLE